jgi:hypothetical protein
MKAWASAVKKLNLNLGIIIANNHYAGFRPATANTFRKMIGLPEVVWEEKKQATLGEFVEKKKRKRQS